MNAASWKYLKALAPPAPRLFWASNGGPMPWNAAQGTYNVGRNAEKRRRRAEAKRVLALTR